jgi:hypothetical protein
MSTVPGWATPRVAPEMAADRPAAIGLQLSDHVLRVARLDFRDRPRLTDAAELRLPPGLVTNGIVIDEPTVIGLLRRLWDHLKLTWEPTHVALGSNDARLVMLSLDDEEACAALIDDLAADGTPSTDDFQVLPLRPAESASDSVPVALASRNSINRTVSVVEQAGVSVAGIDIVPLALTRTQPAAWVDHDDVTLRLEDGALTWSVRVGSLVSTSRSWRPSPDADPTFDSIRLASDDMKIRPVTALADVEIGDRLRSRFSLAQLAIPIGAALSSAPTGLVAVDLRTAGPLNLPRRTGAIGEPGVTWVVEALAAGGLDSRRGKKRR